MTLVNSTNVHGIDIAGPNLIVQFNDGSEYIYFDAAVEFDDMLNSPSKGKFVHSILSNYRYTKR